MTIETTLQLNYQLELAVDRAINLPDCKEKGWAAQVIDFGRKSYYVEVRATVCGWKRCDFVIDIEEETVRIERDVFVGSSYRANVEMIKVIEDALKEFSKR